MSEIAQTPDTPGRYPGPKPANVLPELPGLPGLPGLPVPPEPPKDCCEMGVAGDVCAHVDRWMQDFVAYDSAMWRLELDEISVAIADARRCGDDAEADSLAIYAAGLGEPEPEDEPTLQELEAMPVVRVTNPPASPPLGQNIRPGMWKQLSPDASLAALLEDLDVASMDAYQGVEVVAAFKRLESWAAGRAALAAAELSSKPEMSRQIMPGAHLQPSVNGTAADLAIRLGGTRTRGEKLVRLGKAMVGTFAATGAKLLAGEIDAVKADAIISHLWNASDEVAWLVQDQIIDDAPGLTVHQITRQITKTLIAVDPEDAVNRHHRAARGRNVTHPRPQPDCMATSTCHGPVQELAAFDLVLDAAAASAKANGDSRTRDQLRFDAAMAMAQHALATGWIGPAPAGESGDSAAAGDKASAWPLPRIEGAFDGTPRSMRLAQSMGGRLQIDLHVPLSVLLGDAGTGDGAGAGAGGDTGAAGAGDADAGAGDAGAGDADAGDADAGAGLRSGPGPGAENAASASGPLTSPGDATAAVCTGDDEPEPLVWPDSVDVAELQGYGPVTPDIARALAAGGVWRRIVTDPLTGGLLDVGRTRYRPPPGLAAYIRARDRTCVSPGCTAPATICQLDHTTAWSWGGRTDRADLGPLCQRDHPLKTFGLFRVSQPTPGVFVWTTPSGHRYRREIDGRTTELPPLPADAPF